MPSKIIHKVPAYKYRVDFSAAYAHAGEPSVRSISQTTKISRPTVTAMIEGVTVDNISTAVAVLADYFEVNWKDCVETEEVEGNTEALTEGELKTA